MDLKTSLIAAFIAAGFVSWPSLAKPLGTKHGVIVFLVLAIALLVTTIVNYRELGEIRTVSAKSLTIIICVAMVNGVTTVLYAKFSADPNIQTGTFLSMVTILMVCFGPIADRLLNGAKLNNLQYLGLALALPVVWLLSQKR